MASTSAPQSTAFQFVNHGNSARLNSEAQKLVKRQVGRYSVQHRRASSRLVPVEAVPPSANNFNDIPPQTQKKPASKGHGPGGSRRWKLVVTQAESVEHPIRSGSSLPLSSTVAESRTLTASQEITQSDRAAAAESASDPPSQHQFDTFNPQDGIDAFLRDCDLLLSDEPYSKAADSPLVRSSQSRLGRAYHSSAVQRGPGVVCFDPFHTLPMRYTYETMKYLHHFWIVTPKESICFRGRGVWFEFMKDDPALCNVIVCHLSLWYSVMRGEAYTEANVHRASALSLLRRKLTCIETDLQQRTHVIIAISILVLTESLSGSYSDVEVHFNALKRIIRMCGGLNTTDYSPAVRMIVYWAYDAAECALAQKYSVRYFENRTPTIQDCLCICLNIMANVWRRPVNRPKIIITGPALLKYVLERLEGGFMSDLSDKVYAHKLIWVLVIACTGSTPLERPWFVEQLAEVCYALDIRSWAEVHTILDRNYWSASWDNPRGALWTELDARLQMKMQSALYIEPTRLILLS